MILPSNYEINMDKESGDAILLQLGQKIREIRNSKKLSLRAVAQRCDLDHSDIGKIEKGLKNCQLLTLVELAKGLDTHPQKLLDLDFPE